MLELLTFFFFKKTILDKQEHFFLFPPLCKTMTSQQHDWSVVI